MVSKNNKEFYQKHYSNRAQRFGLRKLSIGVASVLLGSLIFLGGTSTAVHADQTLTTTVASQATVNSAPNSGTVNSQSTSPTSNSSANNVASSASTATSSENTADNGTTSNAASSASKSLISAAATTSSASADSASTSTLQTSSGVSAVIPTAQDTVSATSASTTEEEAKYTGSTIITTSTATAVVNGTINSEVTGSQYLVDNSSYHQFKAGDTAQIIYTLQSYKNSASGTPDFDGTGKFLLVIPKGFTLNGDFAYYKQNSSSKITATSKELGTLNTGETVYEVDTNYLPAYNDSFFVVGQLKVDATNPYYGAETYNSTNQLAYAMASGDMIANSMSSEKYTLTMSDGTTYDVYASPYPYNWTYSNQITYNQIKYTINLTQELTPTVYTIVSDSVKAVAGTTTTYGAEELTGEIKATGKNVTPGSYMDIRLGMPYTNSAGETVYQNYDTTLDPDPIAVDMPDGTQIATIFNMGDYYRIVFNQNADKYDTPDVKFDLTWSVNNASGRDFRYPTATTTSDASTDGNIPVAVYQTTTDSSKDGKYFSYAPQNDLIIGTTTLTSGLKVKGQYVYTAGTILGSVDNNGKVTKANQSNTSFDEYSTNRGWNVQNQVTVNTHWDTAFDEGVDLDITGNTFSLTAKVPVDSTGQISYEFISDSDLATEIKKLLARNVQQTVSESLTNDSTTYLSSKGSYTANTPNVSVTVTGGTPTTSDGYETATWNVTLNNLDTTNYPKINLVGAMSNLVVASAEGFTMPSTITTYAEDMAASQSTGTSTYGGTNNTDGVSAETSNTTLMDTLKTLPEGYVGLTYTDSNGQSQTVGSNQIWGAAIKVNMSGNLAGAASAADLVTATLYLVKNGDTTNAQSFTIQEGTGSSIIFGSNAENAYKALLDDGYVVRSTYNAVTASGNTYIITPGSALSGWDLSTASFGQLSKTGYTKFYIFLTNKDSAKYTFSDTNIWVWDDELSTDSGSSNGLALTTAAIHRGLSKQLAKNKMSRSLQSQTYMKITTWPTAVGYSDPQEVTITFPDNSTSTIKVGILVLEKPKFKQVALAQGQSLTQIEQLISNVQGSSAENGQIINYYRSGYEPSVSSTVGAHEIHVKLSYRVPTNVVFPGYPYANAHNFDTFVFRLGSSSYVIPGENTNLIVSLNNVGEVTSITTSGTDGKVVTYTPDSNGIFKDASGNEFGSNGTTLTLSKDATTDTISTSELETALDTDELAGTNYTVEPTKLTNNTLLASLKFAVNNSFVSIPVSLPVQLTDKPVTSSSVASGSGNAGKSATPSSAPASSTPAKTSAVASSSVLPSGTHVAPAHHESSAVEPVHSATPASSTPAKTSAVASSSVLPSGTHVVPAHHETSAIEPVHSATPASSTPTQNSAVASSAVVQHSGSTSSTEKVAAAQLNADGQKLVVAYDSSAKANSANYSLSDNSLEITTTQQQFDIDKNNAVLTHQSVESPATDTAANDSQNNKKLPQTGNDHSEGLIGLGISSVLLALGLSSFDKRKQH